MKTKRLRESKYIFKLKKNRSVSGMEDKNESVKIVCKRKNGKRKDRQNTESKKNNKINKEKKEKDNEIKNKRKKGRE